MSHSVRRKNNFWKKADDSVEFIITEYRFVFQANSKEESTQKIFLSLSIPLSRLLSSGLLASSLPSLHALAAQSLGEGSVVENAHSEFRLLDSSKSQLNGF